MARKYRVELWYKGQQRIGDIRYMTRNLRWSKKRNGVYTIDFSLDQAKFEEFCARIGEVSKNVMAPLLIDIRIKVRNTYVIGATVIEAPPNFNQGDATIQVHCDGFLRLLSRRRVTANFAGNYTGDMIKNTLATFQGETNGNMNITFNPLSYLGNNSLRVDSYSDKNFQDMLTERAGRVSDPFDFEFAADRTLRLYQKIGNNRPDIKIAYPAGQRNKIDSRSMTMENTGENVANRIKAIGGGFGDEAITAWANDTTLQTKYGIIEDTVTFNDVSDPDTLQQKVDSELARRKEVLLLPKLATSGDFLKTDEVIIGDRVNILQNLYPLFALDGLYRIEQIDVNVDDNDHEDIDLTVDNLTL